jgi:imidazolonepropionase-like amidohydrolase
MNQTVYFTVVVILFVAGLGLLVLTNSGFLSFGKPYIVRKSPDLRLQQPENTLVAFVNVSVVPMDREGILENQTVIVRDGLIERIGDGGEVDVPGEALIVEGEGKYLMPGLADMHVHVKEENELLLFVANGVTTVRDMWGTTGFQLRLGFPDQLELREQIAQGQLLGPTIFAAGPIMEGPPPTMPLMPVFETPEEAEESVAWQATQGYDFVKVYDQLSVETYSAILKAAQEHGLPVIGHAPKQVGLDAVLAGGQVSIEHLTGYIDPDAADLNLPEDKLATYAEMTRESGVWNCPTFGVYQKLVPDEEIEQLERQPGMEYVSPRMRVIWKLFLRGSRGNITYEGSDYPARIAEIYTRMTKALHDARAKVILGTDTDNPYLVPGFSLHDELGYLVQAGFTPYEAIEAGTRNAAEALGRLDEFGTVAVGKRADLILVEENPLEDVANVGQRVGLMLRGHWLPEAQLREMLDELVDSYTPSFVERVWPVGLIVLGVFLTLRRLFMV